LSERQRRLFNPFSEQKTKHRLRKVLGNRISIQVGEQLVARKPKQEDSILALTDPTDLAIEALRGLRTSLHFAMLEAPNNRLMLTGPSPAVGKSFVSANLATICAQG